MKTMSSFDLLLKHLMISTLRSDRTHVKEDPGVVYLERMQICCLLICAWSGSYSTLPTRLVWKRFM